MTGIELAEPIFDHPPEGPFNNITDYLARRLELIAIAATNPLILPESYPLMTSAYDALALVAQEAKSHALAQLPDLDRQHEIDRLASHFGMEGDIIALPAAGEAIALAIQSMTKPEANIILPASAWHNYRRYAFLTDETRYIVELPDDRESIQATLLEKGKEGDLIILTIPTSPFMDIPQKEVLQRIAEIADEKGITTLFDEVFRDWASPDFTIPRSQSFISVRDFGKILALNVFPQAALVEISHAALKRGGSTLRYMAEIWNHVTPSAIELRILADVAENDEFPRTIHAVKQLTVDNAQHLRAILPEQIDITQYGPFALVHLITYQREGNEIATFAREHGLQGYYVSDFRPNIRFDALRVPLVMDTKHFLSIAGRLREKLKQIERTFVLENSIMGVSMLG